MRMILEDWWIQDLGEHGSVVWGYVYNNPNFREGCYIHTSGVQVYDIVNMLIQTRNSIYALGRPHPNETTEKLEAVGKTIMDLHTGVIENA